MTLDAVRQDLRDELRLLESGDLLKGERVFDSPQAAHVRSGRRTHGAEPLLQQLPGPGRCGWPLRSGSLWFRVLARVFYV